MAEMRTERKSIFDYLSKNKFLIPIYQRAYVWGEDECEQLWEDVLVFFDDISQYDNSNDEYFLGSVIMYKENNQQNIIDGQQRTTTLSLLIRALYQKAMNHTNISELISKLSSCLWDRNKLNGDIDYKKLHLKSEVAIDSDNELLEKILSDEYSIQTDENLDNLIKKSKSNYEKNYLYFCKKIDELSKNRPNDWYNFCLCLLDDCIILPIECDGQDNALRIFNTLNDRGLALDDSDIFKGRIYESKNNKDRKKFAKEWKELENKIANSNYLKNENIGFLFTQYMHIIRALHDEVDTVIPGTLSFFTKKDKTNSKGKKVNFGANEDLLTKKETFLFIQELGEFWCNPKEYFSPQSQKYFDILNIYQNKIWQMVASVCFYTYKPEKINGNEKNIFDSIFPQLLSYCALGLILGKGGSSGLFWGFMKANTLIKDKKIEKIFVPSVNIPELAMPKLEYFTDFCIKALPKHIRYLLVIYILIYDKNQKWEWNTNNKNYSVIKGEIEHIFPKKWKEANYNGWNEEEADKFLEYIGNKTLLEKKQNIQAGNGYFNYKKGKYLESNFLEAKHLGNSTNTNWLKEDIEARNEKIYNRLKDYIEGNLR